MHAHIEDYRKTCNKDPQFANFYSKSLHFKQKILIPISMPHPLRTIPQPPTPPTNAGLHGTEVPWKQHSFSLGSPATKKKTARYGPWNPAYLMNRDPFLSWFIIDNPHITG